MKILKNILIILLFLNILLLIYLIIIPKIKTYDYTSYAILQEDIKREKGIVDDTNMINPVRENILQLENESIYNNYKGELVPRLVNIKLQDLLEGGFEEIYKATVGMDENRLANYLNLNIEDIAMKTGITTFVDFAKFVQKIQIYKDSNIKCEKAEIIEGSYVNGNAYDTFKVQLTYDNGQAIVFNVSLSNRDFMDTPIIIIK